MPCNLETERSLDGSLPSLTAPFRPLILGSGLSLPAAAASLSPDPGRGPQREKEPPSWGPYSSRFLTRHTMDQTCVFLVDPTNRCLPSAPTLLPGATEFALNHMALLRLYPGHSANPCPPWGEKWSGWSGWHQDSGDPPHKQGKYLRRKAGGFLLWTLHLGDRVGIYGRILALSPTLQCF